MNRNRPSVRARGSLLRIGLLIGPMKPGNARSLSRKRRLLSPQPHEQPHEPSSCEKHVSEQSPAAGTVGGMIVSGDETLNKSAVVGGPAAEASGTASSSGSRARHRVIGGAPPEAAGSLHALHAC